MKNGSKAICLSNSLTLLTALWLGEREWEGLTKCRWSAGSSPKQWEVLDGERPRIQKNVTQKHVTSRKS